MASPLSIAPPSIPSYYLLASACACFSFAPARYCEASGSLVSDAVGISFPVSLHVSSRFLGALNCTWVVQAFRVIVAPSMLAGYLFVVLPEPRKQFKYK